MNEILIDTDQLTPDTIALMSEEVGTLSAMSLEKRKRLPKSNWQGIQQFDEYALPYPTVLLGVGMALWDNVRYAVCPGCGNRELETYEFCLRCDRWGMDPFIQRRSSCAVIHTYTQHKALDVDMEKRLDKIRK